MGECAQDIAANLIDPAPILLRPVNPLSQEYLDMVAAFREDGMFLNSILVRPRPGGRYEVVDGMWRWTAGHEAGMKVFQCTVKDSTDKQVLVDQIKCNATRTDTDPIEYARHLRRLMDLEGTELGLKELAELTERSRSWISEMLTLNNLKPDIQKMVTRGQITLGNAQYLAKLKPYLQHQHLLEAQQQSTVVFRKTISAAINVFRENLKVGKMEAFQSDEIRPYVRKIRNIIAEMHNWQVGSRMIVKHGCISPLDGWKLAVQWLMNMDPDEMEFRRGKLQRMELERLDDLERLATDRDERKQTLDKSDNPEYDD